jgi:3-dehydroquinate synthetase
MVYAARRSEALGCSPPGTAERLELLCQRFDLPTQLPPIERRAYLSALRVDKKKRDSRIHYVVLEGIGRAKTVPLTPAQIAAAVPRGSARGRSAGAAAKPTRRRADTKNERRRGARKRRS